RFLGISMRLVELERHVSAQQPLRRAADGLSRRLYSVADGLHKMGGRVRDSYAAGIHQRTRHQTRGLARRRATSNRFYSRDLALRGRAVSLAPQSDGAVGAARKPLGNVFGAGLALAMWNYAGYEQLSSV